MFIFTHNNMYFIFLLSHSMLSFQYYLIYQWINFVHKKVYDFSLLKSVKLNKEIDEIKTWHKILSWNLACTRTWFSICVTFNFTQNKIWFHKNDNNTPSHYILHGKISWRRAKFKIFEVEFYWSNQVYHMHRPQL